MAILRDDLLYARDRLRHANEKMEEAKKKWEKQKAGLIRYVEANAYNFNETTRRRKFADDYALNDAMDAYNFWGKEVGRWSAAIHAEIAVAQILNSRDGGNIPT